MSNKKIMFSYLTPIWYQIKEGDNPKMFVEQNAMIKSVDTRYEDLCETTKNSKVYHRTSLLMSK